MTDSWEVIGEETPLVRIVTGGTIPEEKVSFVLRCPNGHLVALISNPGLHRSMVDWTCSFCPPENGRSKVWPMPWSGDAEKAD